MPGPAHSHEQTTRLPVTEPRHGVSERDIALELPEWDLLPPAEFLDRHRRR
ncbi:hypothetical protein ACIRG5_06520 [Lentzea sp. NPDC102401]|uniref:hypothetical protein n=1 Tax=Lentzea sp. NPDC102401 TaxID=3364128 RepID=UPI00381510C5